MKIDGFEWDEANVVKNIVRYNTYPGEIEETFYNKYKLRKTKLERFLLYGVTDGGRYLFVVFTINRKNNRNIARVISARDMKQMEKRYYHKK